MKTLKLLVLATVLAASPTCKKKKEAAPTPTTDPGSASGAMATPDAPDMAGSGSAADPAAGSGSAAMTDETADYIQVYAEHAEKKPTDPVIVNFEKFTVKKAAFDPAKIEGGTATIEVDLASLKSGSDKRDGHLTTADYIDTSKFTTMTIDIVNVKKKDDKNFTADAKVKLRGVDKTYPVTFEVVEAKDDWIRVKGEHKFPRLDFKVGKEKTGPDESVAQDLTVKMQLTLKKT
jgi:polyisoprenoid-binding protein YceI